MVVVVEAEAGGVGIFPLSLQTSDLPPTIILAFLELLCDVLECTEFINRCATFLSRSTNVFASVVPWTEV